MSLGNLTPTRDFTYVTDTVEAFLSIAGCGEAVGRVVNTGSGQEISVGDLVERSAAAVGRRARIEHRDERVRPAGSEVERLCANAEARPHAARLGAGDIAGRRACAHRGMARGAARPLPRWRLRALRL